MISYAKIFSVAMMAAFLVVVVVTFSMVVVWWQWWCGGSGGNLFRGGCDVNIYADNSDTHVF